MRTFFWLFVRYNTIIFFWLLIRPFTFKASLSLSVENVGTQYIVHYYYIYQPPAQRLTFFILFLLCKWHFGGGVHDHTAPCTTTFFVYSICTLYTTCCWKVFPLVAAGVAKIIPNTVLKSWYDVIVVSKVISYKKVAQWLDGTFLCENGHTVVIRTVCDCVLNAFNELSLDIWFFFRNLMSCHKACRHLKEITRSQF